MLSLRCRRSRPTFVSACAGIGFGSELGKQMRANSLHHPLCMAMPGVQLIGASTQVASAMGSEDESTLSVATWRVLTLFLFIIAIDLVCEFGNEAITHHFRHKQQSGLLHAWEQLKFETMALGLVSLLLIVGEDQLLKICIDSSGDSKEEDSGARRLLAKALEHSCPDGQEPVWESKLIHKAHLLIFLIAAVHILYSMTSIGLSLLAMRRWKNFEKQVSQTTDALPEPWALQQGHKKSGMFLGFMQLFRQACRPLDLGTYAALRRLFLEKMNVAPDFNFAAFVSDYLAEEFSSVVKFDIFMWLLAIVWVAFPKGWYAGFIITAMFVVLSIASGAKLHSIAINMALQAPQDPAASKNEAQGPPDAPAHGSSGLGRPATGPATDTPVSFLGPPRAQQQRVSLPAAIAEGMEDVTHVTDVSSHLPDPAPAAPDARADAAADTAPSAQLLLGAKAAQQSSSSGGSGGAKSSSSGGGGGAKADVEPPKLDPKALFWFGKPRLMLRIFRYAYFENALALAVLVFGFWKEDGSVFGRESQYGRGAFAIAWLFVDLCLLLLLHSSMFLLPLYALTAAAAEFSHPEHVLEFARERGIREDLVSFLEATEPAEEEKVSLAPTAEDSVSLPAPPQHSTEQAAALIPAVTPRTPTPQNSPMPSPSSRPISRPKTPQTYVSGSGPADLRRLSDGSAAPRGHTSRLAKISCPPDVTHPAAAAAGSSAPAAAGMGGPYAAASAAPVPIPADVRSTLLHRVSAAGTLQRQSVPIRPGLNVPSLQRPSVPCLPYSTAGTQAGPRAGIGGAGAAAGGVGYTHAQGPSQQELQRTSMGGGLSRPSVYRRMSMMADVVLGTDFLERSAQTSAPHGGNVARASDGAAVTGAHTTVPFVISASRHAHSVQGLLEAMALQRMVELSQAAAAAAAAPDPPVARPP
eukprot:jgi/Ulvmu1/5829/UM025_0087.1